MAMKLHGVMLSTCTKRVAIALEELEVRLPPFKAFELCSSVAVHVLVTQARGRRGKAYASLARWLHEDLILPTHVYDIFLLAARITVTSVPLG